MDSWWKIATRAAVVRRGIAYSVVVGLILIAINHGDAVWRADLSTTRVLKMGLTVVVPYLVSTFSSVSAIRESYPPNTP